MLCSAEATWAPEAHWVLLYIHAALHSLKIVTGAPED